MKETITDCLIKQIQTWVVNDYFTPNIKAEVILDTLLTPYIAQIVEIGLGSQVGELVWLTKEMSIPVNDNFGSCGPKVDYVLAGADKVYLVELKTTNSSIDDPQMDKYLETCQGKLFGEKLGRQLLSILDKPKRGTFKIQWNDECLKEYGSDPLSWKDDEVLRRVFRNIVKKPFDQSKRSEDIECQKYECKECQNRECAKIARNLILKNKWTQRKKYSSRKYLYTLGQIVYYLNKDKDNKLWNKEMQVIYLTPNENKYIGSFPNINLSEAVKKLQPDNRELVELLQSIITAILPSEEKTSCQD